MVNRPLAMINIIKTEAVLKQHYKDKKGILIIYSWDWRINRFIRDFSELIDYNKNFNANGIDPTIENLEFDISRFTDKDKMDTLTKYLKRYNFKYFIS